MEYRIEVLASFKKEAKRLRKHYASFIDDYEKLLGELESSSKLFLVFRAPVRSKAVYIGSGNKCFVPTFPEHPSFEGLNLETMQEVTLECRVMVNSFTKSDPYISSIMGFEGDVCMRFGDVKIGKTDSVAWDGV